MQFELNEIEARREQYPSTISFLNLLNALIAEEKDVSDRGRRYGLILCNFSFIFPSVVILSRVSFLQIFWHLQVCI